MSLSPLSEGSIGSLGMTGIVLTERCPICQDELIEQRETLACGHHMCATPCFEQFLERGFTRCPCCRENINGQDVNDVHVDDVALGEDVEVDQVGVDNAEVDNISLHAPIVGNPPGRPDNIAIRPVEPIHLLSFLPVPIQMESAVSVPQIESAVSQLERNARLELSTKMIKSRKRSRTSLPYYIRNLRRKADVLEKKLREFEAHRPFDEDWTRLQAELRLATQWRRHDK